MPPPPDTAPATLLLVGGAAAARKQLAASLFSTGTYRVEQAADPSSALTCLRNELVDLVLTDLRLPEYDGCQLLERIEDEAHLSSVPVIMLTEETSVRDKVRALQAGARDYVVQPVAFAELCARIDAVLARHRADNVRLRRNRNYSLAGDFTAISFPELVGMLQVGRRSGRLAVMSPRASGELIFVEGMVYHASFGTMDGEEAFYRIVMERRGQFEFEPRQFDLTSVRNTIAISPTALLMEGSRRLDAWIREHGDGERPAIERLAPRPAQRSEHIVEAPAATPDHLEALLGLVQDAEHRGKLHLIPRDELFAWNDRVDGEVRCRVLLIAKPSEAVAAMTSVATPLTASQLETTLHFDQRVMGLSFEAHGSRLDVLLLNEELPAFVLDELYHQPAVLIFAPGHGDGLTLALHSLAELEAVLHHLDPRDVLCCGQTSVVDVLHSAAERAGRDPRVHHQPASLGELRIRFRDLLAEALRVWNGELAAAPPA